MSLFGWHNYGPMLIHKVSFLKGITRGLYQGCSYHNQRRLQLYRRTFKRELRKAVNRVNQFSGWSGHPFKHSPKPTQHNGCRECFESRVIEID